MELTVVRHLCKEIEVGNGAWAMVMANEQLDAKHPLQRAFIFKARQTSKMSTRLAQALSEGKKLTDLSPALQREVSKSRFNHVARKRSFAVSSQNLSTRFSRITEVRAEIFERQTMYPSLIQGSTNARRRLRE